MQEMQETWVRSLGQEDSLEVGMATHSSILAMDREAWRATVHGVGKSWTQLSGQYYHTSTNKSEQVSPGTTLFYVNLGERCLLEG